ncbi:MAG TPA: glycosyltransferase family 4 protein [Terriglobales bacterium]|nr:glycosyltransferase family 4 protein [Terriglobales bacterium]
MILENCSYLRDARVGKQAKALQQRGYQVSVISPEPGKLPSRTVIEGVTVYGFPSLSVLPGTMGYFLEYAYATFAIAVLSAYIALVKGFDIIHIANPPDCIILATTIYKLLGKRIIYDQHDLSPELYEAKFSRPSRLLLRLQLRLERVSYQLADHIIVTNESYKKVALGRGRQATQKVTVVRNGPELERLHALKPDEELRKRSSNIIAFVGVVGYQDGLDYLCRALSSLCCDWKQEDFLCIVVGDGDALSSVKALARELGIDHKIWFVGWVSDPEVYFRYLSTADICVAPEPSNKYNDHSTFVKIMEYMLAGKPVVAFDLPESRVSAEGAALYASPNDYRDFAAKIATLMVDERLRHSMGKLGQQRIESRLAWQYSIPGLLAVYDRVSGRQQRQAHA